MSDELSSEVPDDGVSDDGVSDDEVRDDEVVDEDDPDDEDDGIPSVVLAAIKDRMHARRLSPPEDPGHLEVSLGTADDDLHVVDDGPDHCMIGRSVGFTPDGCVYVLVGRVTRYDYEQLRDGDIDVADAYSDARDISLCAVFQQDGRVENIALIRLFGHAADIPGEYLPPSPYLEFSEDEFPDS